MTYRSSNPKATECSIFVNVCNYFLDSIPFKFPTNQTKNNSKKIIINNPLHLKISLGDAFIAHFPQNNTHSFSIIFSIKRDQIFFLISNMILTDNLILKK